MKGAPSGARNQLFWSAVPLDEVSAYLGLLARSGDTDAALQLFQELPVRCQREPDETCYRSARSGGVLSRWC